MAFIGWNLGGFSSDSGRSGERPVTGNRFVRPQRHARSISGPAGEAAERLAWIRSTRNPSDRMRATVDLANSIPPAEFAAWVDGGWFNLRGVELTLFTKIIQERWRLEDPEGLVAWAMKNSTDEAEGILKDWADNDPQRVLDLFKAHPNDRAEMQQLANIAGIHPELALRRLQEMATAGISSNDAAYAGGLFDALAITTPDALEAALDSLPPALKSNAQIALVGSRLKSSFDEEFASLKDRPDGFKLLQAVLSRGERRELQAKLVENLAGLPPAWLNSIANNPFQFLGYGASTEKWAGTDFENLGMNKQAADRIRTYAIGQLASSKPERALELLNGFELSETTRAGLISQIFAGQESAKIDSLMAALDSDEEREMARKARTRYDVSPSDKIESPSDLLAKVAAFDSSQGNSYELMNGIRNWDSSKMTELKSGFRELPEETKYKVADLLTRSGLSLGDPAFPGELIRYLVANPAPDQATAQDPISLASGYIMQSARTDPEAAGEWVQSLPDGDPKLWAQKNLHSIWSQYDPQAADQWMKSLPAAEQAQVKALKSR